MLVCSAESKRIQFWKMLRTVIEMNGDPFSIKLSDGLDGDSAKVVHDSLREHQKTLEIRYDADNGLVRIEGTAASSGTEFVLRAQNLMNETIFTNIVEKTYEMITELSKENNIISTGQKIHAKTHAELLNTILHKNPPMRGYMKAGYRLDADHLISMIRLDNCIRGNWTNEEINENTIVERYHGTEEVLSDYDTPCGERIAFQVIRGGDIAYYLFKGVYALDDESTSHERIWRKVSDQFDFKKYI